MFWTLLTLVMVAIAFATGFALAPRWPRVRIVAARIVAERWPRVRALVRSRRAERERERDAAAALAEEAPLLATPSPSETALVGPAAAAHGASVALPGPAVSFEPGPPRGTRTTQLAEHAPEWRDAMTAVGERLAAGGVSGIVFVHGTFTGSDPLSAYRIVERALPGIGRDLARTLRKKTRGYMQRMLGDLGNFGSGYVRLFEEALRPSGARIPCTDFVWSSENHHVGRLEGALGLIRALATHAELGQDLPARSPGPRLLVLGHSHAGQLFALVTQLLARSIATEAILDIARARSLDVAALEADLETLDGHAVDFVTFGSPTRYAWAAVEGVRALHVIGIAPDATKASLSGDWIRRLGGEGSDFPALGVEDRRINAALAPALGAGFAPARLAAAFRSGGLTLPPHGEIAFVAYGERGLSGVMSSGLGHGAYTRLDAMLFHARLVADRLYPSSSI